MNSSQKLFFAKKYFYIIRATDLCLYRDSVMPFNIFTFSALLITFYRVQLLIIFKYLALINKYFITPHFYQGIHIYTIPLQSFAPNVCTDRLTRSYSPWPMKQTIHHWLSQIRCVKYWQHSLPKCYGLVFIYNCKVNETLKGLIQFEFNIKRHSCRSVMSLSLLFSHWLILWWSGWRGEMYIFWVIETNKHSNQSKLCNSSLFFFL